LTTALRSHGTEIVNELGGNQEARQANRGC
jgi:hypothetical protein